MKKIIKSRIFYFILGVMITGSIGVYAAVQYTASQITYNKNGQSTVDAALNDLYTKQASALGELIWVNPDPTIAFEPTTLNIDLTKYQSIIVLGTYSRSSSLPGYVKINVGSEDVLRIVYNQNDITKRSISVKSDKIEIAGGLDWQDSSFNTAAIPTYIIGIK